MEVARQSLPDRFHTTVWQAPLVPAALAVTAGAIADRYVAIPLVFSTVLLTVSLAAWLFARWSSRGGLSLVYLGIACSAAGAGYHHWHRDWYPAREIGNFATNDQCLVRIRGIVVEESRTRSDSKNDSLRSYVSADRTITTLEATELKQNGGWLPVSGKVRLTLAGPLAAPLRVADTAELIGLLAKPESPANPGEFDYASQMRDERIRAVIYSETSPNASIVTGQQRHSWAAWLGIVRGWGKRVLADSLPPQTANIAIALLLGDGSAMSEIEWDKYGRTGVMHVLVVSGQHLVVLAVFVRFLLRIAMVRQRYAALVIATVMILYCALSGGRPPAVRAVVMVCIYCGAILLAREPHPEHPRPRLADRLRLSAHRFL